MRFSNSVEYAIHGLIYLAKTSAPTTILISDIARQIAVPEAYLRKIFQHLTKAGLVLSLRGLHGGFSLARSPAEINLKDIVEAIEGSLPIYTCLRTQRHCNLSAICPVKQSFDKAREAMGKVLQETNLQTILTALAKQPEIMDWLKIVV